MLPAPMHAGPGFPEVQRPAGSLGVESLRVDWKKEMIRKHGDD